MSPEQEERLLKAIESIAASLKPSGPLSPAERAKRYRLNRHGKSDDPTVTNCVTRHENSDVSGKSQRHVLRDAVGVGGRSPEPLITSKTEISSSPIQEEERHASRDVTNESVTQLVTGNATADGAWGGTVDSWADGVRSVTRSTYIPPRGKAAVLLVSALKLAGAPGDEPCAAAFALGAAYAKANPGRTLTPFHFSDWMGSGRPTGVRRVAHELQPGAEDGGKSEWELREERRLSDGK